MSPSTEQRENRELAAELKFVVARPLGQRIQEWMRLHLEPDPNAQGEQHDTYQITSLYFDTEQFDVFHRKGSFGRSKYRIRRYGEAEVAFLERKLKTRGLVSKRRSAVQLSELELLTCPEANRHWKGYWYHQRLKIRQLRPICEITYHRTARIAMTSSGLSRMTLDDGIRAVPLARLMFDGSAHGQLLLKDQMIVELKYRSEIPALFRGMIEQFGLTPQPVSKYRLAAARLGLVPVSASNLSANASLDSSVCPSS